MPKRLSTNRLILRKISNKDASSIFNIFSSTEVMKYYGKAPITTLEEAEELIKHFKKIERYHTGLRWAIVFDKKVIGTIGYQLWNHTHHRAEIGYEILPEYWGKGIAKEAVEEIIIYGFNEMQLTRIGAVVFKENENSQKLLEKLNFEKEGLLKAYMHQSGSAYDCFVYSIVREEE